MRLVLAIGDDTNESPHLGDDESALVITNDGEVRVIIPEGLTGDDKVPSMTLFLISIMWRMHEDESFVDGQMEWMNRLRQVQ